MIEQVLNRDYVLEYLRAVRAQLESDAGAAGGVPVPPAPPGPPGGDRRRGGAGPPDDLLQPEPLGAGDIGVALRAVAEAADHEEAGSSGQHGYEPARADRRGGNQPPALDDRSFFSRDPVVSLLQSALEQHLEAAFPDDIETAAAAAPTDRRGGAADVAVTARSLAGWESTEGGEGRRLFGKFQPADVRWISAVVAMGIRKYRGRHAFNPTPAEPVPLKPDTRLVVVGDWGSGLPRARKVADQMRAVVEQGLEDGVEQHVVHLGDVYYSGWKHEYDRRFLPWWPVRSEEADRIGSWSLNANHDMYSGGHDYFDHLLAEPRFARQQRSSMFSLVSPNWQILGLDTGWQDGELQDPQADWVLEEARAARTSGRRLLLLSHHQLFSAYELPSRKLFEQLRPALETERIGAWFWGHEHRCMQFDPIDHVDAGRCVGHGGVPVYMAHGANDSYPAPGSYEYRAYLADGLERWALFGFAVLDFHGQKIDVRYIDENGYQHRSETIG